MEPSFSPVIRRKTVDIVIDSLEAQILDGTIDRGSRLPSEEQLALQMNVGRRAVREALKLLEAKGLVEIQPGIGASVSRNDLDSFLAVLTRNVTSYLSLNKADVQHVVHLRLLLETAGLKQLVEQPDAERLERLSESITGQRLAYEAGDFQKYQECHLVFHSQIVDALENPIISMIYKQVIVLVRGTMEWAGSNPKVSAAAIRLHGRMLEAVRQGSLALAEQLLREHLTASASELSRELQP